MAPPRKVDNEHHQKLVFSAEMFSTSRCDGQTRIRECLSLVTAGSMERQLINLVVRTVQ